jgi:hypothetical protein
MRQHVEQQRVGRRGLGEQHLVPPVLDVLDALVVRAAPPPPEPVRALPPDAQDASANGAAKATATSEQTTSRSSFMRPLSGVWTARRKGRRRAPGRAAPPRPAS